MVFLDLSKALDSVIMDMLWEVLRRLGCPDKIVNIIKVFHTGMTVAVLVAGEESELFDVGMGIKQG